MDSSYMMYLSMAGSIASMLATVYFWRVRMRKERPALRPFVADKEFFLGIGRADVRQIGVKLGLIVANYSVLPNSILAARLSIRLRGGWYEVGQVAFDKQTPQPFNIPPMQTILLRLTGTLSFPYEDALEEGAKTTSNYLHHFVAQPVQMKLELRHLHHRMDVHVLTLPADEARAAEEKPRLSRAA
ncbi:MAG: hypothetical protein U0793_18600 [Gemmataceae bacterium]